MMLLMVIVKLDVGVMMAEMVGVSQLIVFLNVGLALSMVLISPIEG